MKKIKKLLLIFILLVVSNCGYKKLINNENYTEPKINSIKVDGPIDLVFNLKSLLQIKETNNTKDPNIKITISKQTSSETKDSKGFTTSEKIQISAAYSIYDNQAKIISKDTVVVSKIYQVTSSLSQDAEKVSVEENNLLSQVSNQIKLKILLALQN